LNTQVLSHSARRTRLLWPLKSNHYLRQWSVFIWRNSQSVTAHSIHKPRFVQWDPEQVILKLYLTRVQIIKCKSTWSDLDAGVWMYWREEWKSPTPDILAWGLFTSGSSRAVKKVGTSSRAQGPKTKGGLSTAYVVVLSGYGLMLHKKFCSTLVLTHLVCFPDNCTNCQISSGKNKWDYELNR
jgi:hypothetical protein